MFPYGDFVPLLLSLFLHMLSHCCYSKWYFVSGIDFRMSVLYSAILLNSCFDLSYKCIFFPVYFHEIHMCERPWLYFIHFHRCILFHHVTIPRCIYRLIRGCTCVACFLLVVIAKSFSAVLTLCPRSVTPCRVPVLPPLNTVSP